MSYDDDDGRTIASMDLDVILSDDRGIKTKKTNVSKPSIGNQMTRAEARLFSRYALLSGLMIASVFSGVWILFTLFLTKVLFR